MIRALRASAAACAVALAVVAASATSAHAATNTLTQPTTLTGNTTLSSLGIVATGAGVTATFDLNETVAWTQSASVGVTYDPNLVRQGRSLDPSDSYTRTGAGHMSISWTLHNLHVDWNGLGPFDLGNPDVHRVRAVRCAGGRPDRVVPPHDHRRRRCSTRARSSRCRAQART